MMATLHLFGCSNPISSVDHEEETRRIFWLKNPELKQEAEQAMQEAKSKLHDLDDVRELMGKFYETEDILYLSPDILMVFAKNLRGNCEMAAVLGKWALKQIGIQSRIVTLIRAVGSNHAIAVSNDNKIFISNQHVIIIKVPEWWEFILMKFKFKYDLLIDGYMEYKQ